MKANQLGVGVVIVCLGAAVGCGGESGSVEDPGPNTDVESPTGAPVFTRGECSFEIPAGHDPARIDCGTVDVPASRASPDPANMITLSVAVVRHHATPAKDPVVWLNGGPGSSFVNPVYLPSLTRSLLAPILMERDVVFYDQRGAGMSTPSLACPEFDAAIADQTNPDPDARLPQLVGGMAACRDRLAAEGIDLRDYNTEASVADLRDVMTALGYEQWNLFSNSYGTRLAQTAMRDDPEPIRSVILDSPVTLGLTPAGTLGRDGARSFERLFEKCEEDAACALAFPQLGQVVNALFAGIADKPIEIPFGDNQIAYLSDTEFAYLVFSVLYHRDAHEALPAALAGMALGDARGLGVISGLNRGGTTAYGLYYGAQCVEEYAPGVEPLLPAEGQMPAMTKLGDYLDALESAVCDELGLAPTGPIAPVEIGIPTLIFAGELDPITPPANAIEINEALPASTAIVFDNVGHGATATIGAGGCPAELAGQFFADPDAPVDISCADEVPALNFATSIDDLL